MAELENGDRVYARVGKWKLSVSSLSGRTTRLVALVALLLAVCVLAYLIARYPDARLLVIPAGFLVGLVLVLVASLCVDALDPY